MSDTTFILPALCRRDILPEILRDRMNDLFSAGAKDGLVAITLTVATIGDDLNILKDISFTVLRNGKYLHEPVMQSSLPEAIKPDLKNLALCLMGDRDIVSELAELDAHLLVFPENSTRSLTFFQGCAIAYPSDPPSMLQHIAEDLRRGPDLIENRARICTLVMNAPLSQHARLSQGTAALQALHHWQAITGVNADATLTKTGIAIMLPNQGDIISCNTDCIQKHDASR